MKEENGFIGRKHYFLYVAVLYVFTFALLFTVLYDTEKQLRKQNFDHIMENELNSVNIANELLGAEFKTIIADLGYLVTIFSNDYVENSSNNRLKVNWSEFSRLRAIYDQVRFIDAAGDEKIRINLVDGSAVIVPDSQLQNKADRYYFIESAKLTEEQIYVSPLDLNIEHDEIEIPYKPMMRFAAPVFDEHGEFEGVVILNYLAQSVLDRFRDVAESSHGEMVIINSDGYWLSSSDPEDEWNFMFEDELNLRFSYKYPKEWRKIAAGEGQEITEKGLFTNLSVDLGEKISSESYAREIVVGGGNWQIVSYMLSDGDNASAFKMEGFPLAGDVLRENGIYFLILFGFSTVLGWIITRYVNTYQRTKLFSNYDQLTGVYNRRTATQRLDEMLTRKMRHGSALSVCFIDVNGLKQVNDVLGHKAGDELIKSVAHTIQNNIRQYDFVARMGGDEFIIVFPRTESDAAEAVWQRIKEQLNKINVVERRPYVISVSHGIATCTGEMECATTDNLIKEADSIMYKEKREMKRAFDALRKHGEHEV